MTETEIIKVAETIGQSIAAAVTQHIETFKKSIPLTVQLWTRADLSAYLNRKETALNKLICQPGFPERICLPSEQGKSQPLWRAADVINWVEMQQKRRGRPRS